MFSCIRPGAALCGALAVVATCSVTPRAVSLDNAVMEWNQIALTATVTAGQNPLTQSRSMTIVQVAVHDAVNTITGKYSTYFSYGAAPDGANAEAAAIAAAHRTLVTMFPLQGPGLNAARAASLAARGLTEADPGISVGESAASAILAARANDGAAVAQFPYSAPGAGTPGIWVPVGPAPALLPGWGSVTTWVTQSAAQFLPDAPPSLDSGRYARDYNEIKEIGSLTSATRTPDQTEIARFWLATPSAIWNGVARRVIDARGLDLSDSARTLALMYLSASDAGIVCWNAKYIYNHWRPVTAIRNGGLDGNDATVADPTWTSLFPAPQHPEYISGHATNSSAMATTLAYLFGDNPGIAIVATSPTNPAFPRQWSTFSEGVDEVVDARVFSGIHFRTSDEVGARVGRQVAQFVIHQALR
jgi:hypothetical protein